jgi:hypothetical protein
MFRLSATTSSPFDEIKAAIADGELPASAHLGEYAQTPQGHFPKPQNAIGTIRVGYKTAYWIVA